MKYNWIYNSISVIIPKEFLLKFQKKIKSFDVLEQQVKNI